MPADVRLTAHFHFSQFTAWPESIACGRGNEPLAHQVDNLRRVAQLLEAVRSAVGGSPIHVLRGFRRSNEQFGHPDAYAEGRGADFIVPTFGTPREICAHLVGAGLVSERLVHAPGWVHVEVPPFGREPRRQIQTAVFEHGQALRFLEGLV